MSRSDFVPIVVCSLSSCFRAGLLSPSELSNIGKMLKEAVATATSSEFRNWQAAAANRTRTGKRFLVACCVFCAAAVAALLYLYLGTSQGRDDRMHHMANPFFVLGIVSVAIAVGLATLGSLFLRMPSGKCSPFMKAVIRAHASFRYVSPCLVNHVIVSAAHLISAVSIQPASCLFWFCCTWFHLFCFKVYVHML